MLSGYKDPETGSKAKHILLICLRKWYIISGYNNIPGLFMDNYFGISVNNRAN